MKTRRLTPTIGVEITGVDLSAPLPDSTFAAIREAWLHHKVAVFPGQHLTEDGLMRFGQRFGELEIHVRSTYHSRHHPEVMIVSNKKEDGRAIGVLGDGEAVWHIDQSYMPQPTFGTILFGEEIPPEGGDTWFADLATAYDRLPASLKAKIEGQRGVNSVDRHNRRDAAGRPDLAMTAEQLKRAPELAASPGAHASFARQSRDLLQPEPHRGGRGTVGSRQSGAVPGIVAAHDAA